MFKTIKKDAEAQIEIKKSKFIANIYYVESKDDAENKIKEIKKRHFSAKHHCYAYVISGNIEIQKSNDDGEPSGTAGAPILEIINKKNLKNILIIVTRYFGGVLLGTGGLVKAYTDVSQLALENTEIIEKEYGIKYKIEIRYEDLKDITYICKKENILIKEIKYNEKITMILESNEENRNTLLENSKILSTSDIEKNILI